MFNKKLIIDSLKNLSKPSRMTNKNTFDLKESGSKREGFVSAQEGVDTPIYKAVKTGASPIEGKGLFAEQSIRKGDVIGVSHIRKKFMKNGEEYKAPFPSTVLGYYNHSEEPNVYEVDKGDYILMVAGRDIQRGHEITSDYTKHNIGDLEVPDDFKKGGSIKRPSLPNRKSPRSYSRSFEATNKLFAKNPLFAKAKSRKNKIFDPRAQYFDNGGISKLEGDLISKVIMNRNRGVDFVDRAYALGDNPGTPMFNLPDDEQFGQNMSHKMAWGDDDNGQAWMYPTIMNPNNEAIPVPNQYADYISSEGYKNATGMNQYKEGGESEEPCPEGYIRYNGQCVKWQEPNVIETDENTGYNAARGEISQDTRPGSIENNGWWTEHEKYHHLQNLGGGASTAGFLGQRPNNTVASDQAIGDYYDRRDTELEAQTDAMIKADPNLQFIPRNKLQEFTEGFPGANALMYQDPTTEEGEARVREEQFEKDGISMFPKKQYGGLHKFLGGGGNPTCEKPYVWNPETNRCEKKTGCPDDFHFDLKSGRCISNYQKEGKATIKVKPKGTNTYVTATPDQLTAPYDNFWPEDLNLEEIANPVYFPEAQTELNVTYPNQKNKYDDNLKDLATIRKYPDLNYKVVIDPSKPEGFNKNENIYYVKSENTHQARKYKEWEQLKNLEKQNIQKLKDAGFNVKESDDKPFMLPNVSSDYYTYPEPVVDADGTTHFGGRDYKEGWDYQTVTDLERPPQEYYNDPEYLGHVPQNVSFEDFYKGRPGTSMEEYRSRCKGCSYSHGINYKVDDDYLYRNINLSNVDESNEDDYEVEKDLEYEYADPTIESMYPKLEFEEGVDPPDYYTTPTEIEIPKVRIEKGNVKAIKFNLPEYHKNNYLTGKTDAPPFHGKKSHHIKYRPRHLDFGRRDMTRLIPKIVQKVTGYDEKYMQGYEDKEGNYFPGEIEKAEEEGRQINFKGALSLRDISNQKKYNEKWKNSEEENKLIRQQNEDLLKEYGLNREEYVKLYGEFKNGGLIKAADGLGVKQSLSYSPFSYNMPISLAGNTTFNPSQSITYSNPHFGSGILNMFNKKLAKGAYGSPLELSLGRPYFTDDESLTNSSLDYSKPWQPDIEHYNYIKTNAGFNGWENTIYQNIGDSLGVDPNLLTSSDLKKYAAKEALATIKPQYKPGKPIDFNLKYSLLGMRQSTTNPVRGFGSLNVGYNPDSGWYGGGEGGAYGVIAKHMTPETYLRRGLKKKGDWAFIPSLSLGVGIRQKVGYGNEVNDKVKIYQSILEKDAQNGTANAEDYYSDHLSNGLNSHMNYGFRPELKFLYKPAKHFSGILGAKVGVGADLLGGREGQMNEIKANYSPYGEVSFSIPIEDQVQRLKKKIKNIDLPSPSRKYYEEEDYDEGTVDEETEKIETEETETETNGKSTFDEDIQLNFDGQGVGKANCRDGYERPCEKCKCQKIKLPASYTDKRGTHLFGNEPLRFKQGGISLQLTKDEIQKYVDGGYVVEDLSSDPVTFKQDNETEYELGGIIEDEETKKYLESIGYTFETI